MIPLTCDGMPFHIGMPLYDSNGFRVDTILGVHHLRIEDCAGEPRGYVWDSATQSGFYIDGLFATERAALEHCLARLELESARVNRDINRINERIVGLMRADDRERHA